MKKLRCVLSKTIFAFVIAFVIIMGILLAPDLCKKDTRVSFVGNLLHMNLKCIKDYERYKKYAINSSLIAPDDFVIETEINKLNGTLNNLHKEDKDLNMAISLKLTVLVIGIALSLLLFILVRIYF